MADQSRFPELPGALYPLGRKCCGAPDATACHQRELCWVQGVHPESPGYTAAAPVAADAGSGVDPGEIARQRALGWPDMHPEDFCHQCGRPNPNWFADTVEWQTATGSTGDGGGILCPSCLCALYRKVTGKTAIIWRLSIDPRSRDADPVAAEGTDELREVPSDDRVTLLGAAQGWILRHSSQPDGDRWRDNPDHLAWAAENLLCDLKPWLIEAAK